MYARALALNISYKHSLLEKVMQCMASFMNEHTAQTSLCLCMYTHTHTHHR